jgi:transposase
MLVGEKVRLTNRLIATLKGYYPQVLEWFEDKDTQVFCEFLTRYPDLKAAQAAPKEELEQFFKSHHVVQAKTINRRLEQIKQGIVLTTDAGLVEPFQLLVKALIAQLQVLLSTIATFDSKIETLFDAHPDAALFATLPGAGPQLAPRLLVAFGEERDRFQTAQDLLRYAGIAPVQESSGKKSWIHWQASPEGGFPSVGNWRDGVVPNFSGKPLSNGHCKLENTRFGQRRFIKCNDKKGKHIRGQFEL